MKKLLDRFRRWLIRRLGGYDRLPIERPAVNGLRFMAHADLHPNIFGAEIKVSPEYTENREKLLAWARERVTETVARQMVGAGAVIIKERHELPTDKTILRAHVVALVGDEAEEYITCRRWEG